jgi:hypothetical protein
MQTEDALARQPADTTLSGPTVAGEPLTAEHLALRFPAAMPILTQAHPASCASINSAATVATNITASRSDSHMAPSLSAAPASPRRR